MEIKKAQPEDLNFAGEVTRRTIREAYPKYYPEGVVEFFLRWHRDECILTDILAGEVSLLWKGEGERAVKGTVTLHGGEITRPYILPECQGQGFGRALLDFAERSVGEKFGRILAEASLPAKTLYWKRGYRAISCTAEILENGCVLCWDVMEKPWPKPNESNAMRTGAQIKPKSTQGGISVEHQ